MGLATEMLLAGVAVADRRRDDDDSAQPHADDLRRGVGVGPALPLAVVVLVGQRQLAGAVLSLPLAVVGHAVVLPELALLLGRELAVGIDARRVLHLLLLEWDPDGVVVRHLRAANRNE